MRRGAARTWTRRALLAGGGVAGLRAVGPRARAQERALSVLCWPGFDDPEVIERFEDAAELVVRTEAIASDDEIFLYLRADGIGKLGVVMPTNGSVAGLAAAGLIQPLDPGRLSVANGLLERFREPLWTKHDGQTYAVPLLWRTSPMAVAPSLEGGLPGHWLDLFDARFNARLVMLEDGLSHFIIWNRALGLPNPVRVTRSQLSETASHLVDLKRNQVALFTVDTNEAAEALLDGTAWASTTGHEGLARDRDLTLLHPAPGDFAIAATAAIPAGAPDPEAAYAYIDYLLQPETQARLADILGQGVVAEAAVPLLDERSAARFDYDDLETVLSVSPFVGLPPFEDEPGEIASYLDWVLAWDRVRVAPTSLDPRPEPDEPEPAGEMAATLQR